MAITYLWHTANIRKYNHKKNLIAIEKCIVTFLEYFTNIRVSCVSITLRNVQNLNIKNTHLAKSLWCSWSNHTKVYLKHKQTKANLILAHALYTILIFWHFKNSTYIFRIEMRQYKHFAFAIGTEWLINQLLAKCSNLLKNKKVCESGRTDDLSNLGSTSTLVWQQFCNCANRQTMGSKRSFLLQTETSGGLSIPQLVRLSLLTWEFPPWVFVSTGKGSRLMAG